MLHQSWFRRASAVSTAILLASAHSVAAADTCGDLLREHASISLQIRAVENEYPQTARVYRECRAYVDKSSNVGEALVKLLACAGTQCLVIGMDTCDAVFKTLTQLERERDEIEARQRELDC